MFYSRFRYNRSKSGWFDSVIFTDWVINMFIPFVKKKKLNRGDNKVVLMGDNLSSHFTEQVLVACRENNVLFICIPTNSTHLTQPLDVAFYGPLKRYWRAILDSWKKKINKKSQTITKEYFPSLLNKLYKEVVIEGTSNNLVSGFRKCGICPLDRSQVISRLPQTQSTEEIPVEQTVQTVSDAVLDMLRELRPSTSNNPRKKRTKVSVEAGKSIQLEDLVSHQNPAQVTDSDDDELPTILDLHSDPEQSDANDDNENVNMDETIQPEIVAPKVTVNDYVVVKLSFSNDKYCVARILETNVGNLSVKMFTKVHSKFVQVRGDNNKILPSQIVKVLLSTVETRRGVSFDDDELGCISFE